MIEIINKIDNNKFTLLLANKDSECSQYLNLTDGQIFIDNINKKYYLFIENKEELLFDDLQEYFINIFKQINITNLQISLSSFVTNKININDICQIICESIYYSQYTTVVFKEMKDEVKNKTTYYFIDEADNKVNWKEIIQLARIKLESVNFVRDLQDSPPNILNSLTFVEKVNEQLKQFPQLEVEILTKKDIEKESMGLLLAVNQGSNIEPRVMIIKYNNNPDFKDILALVGKGITFDSGGYSLKPDPHMKDMKFDMSGAAIVCGTMLAIAKLKPKKNVIAIALLTENVIGSKAILVDSVVQSMAGKWVEIADTDAEGRLILADGITYAIKEGNATSIIDVATLTGSVSSSLGPWYSGAMANDQNLYNKFSEAALQAKENIWEMPVNKYHKKIMMDSKIADLSNFPGELKAGMSTAAAFLFAFNENNPHLHLDIAGTAWKKSRGTGIMVKSLIQYINN